MKEVKNSNVDINELIDAFEMDNYFERSFINTLTGEVINLTEGEVFSDNENEDFLNEEDIDDEEFEELIPDHFLSLPDKYEINMFGMMEDFCNTVENQKIQQNLCNALGGKGSFGRFMAILHAHEIEKEWYYYLHNRLKEFSIEFCKMHNLKYHYTCPQRFR